MTGNSDSPKQSWQRLGLKHAVRVQAAEYWLALGEFDEAYEELQQIRLSRRNHPEVLRMRERIERAQARSKGALPDVTW